MKKIIVLCMMLMLAGGLAFSQAQDPGFSNTVYTDFGNTSLYGERGGLYNTYFLDRDDTGVKFHGFSNYFTANVELGKLIIAGDITWHIGFDDGFDTDIPNYNFNAVMKPLDGLDIGVGTNLKWEVGPAPSSGSSYSAYNVPYYAGLGYYVNRPDYNIKQLIGAGYVANYFADKALAVRYAFEDIIQVGFALKSGAGKGNFHAGLGIKANIMDLFTIGFAYNGNFETSDMNSIYIGSTISAIETVPIDIWLNFVPNGEDNKNGQNTIGGRVGFIIGTFYLAPEFSVTFWNNENFAASMYVALDTYMSITNEMLLGLNASWGLGSKRDAFYLDEGTSKEYKAGARLNINPYFVWSLNETNKLSIGAHFMPIWWQEEVNGDSADFYWSIPIAWKVTF